MNKIAVIITNRTNYSKLKTVLFKLKKFNVKIEIVASSSILLDKYGKAYKDLENDGFKINFKIDSLLMNDSHEAMVNSIGLSMIQHSSYFANIKPNLVLIVGDRFDTVAAALSASIMNIPIAHIQGGETSGSIDNKVRDIITRISDLHFVATDKSKKRLETIGITSSRIYNYGCPAVEYISSLELGSKLDTNKLGRKLKSPLHIEMGEKFFIILVHPDTTNSQDLSMDVLLSAISTYGTKSLIFYPNVDANNVGILDDISKHRKNPLFDTIKHLPLEGFVHMMGHCSGLIGNSSSGIREAASFGIPVINIGNRQEGRERNKNTFDIECEYNQILKTLKVIESVKFEKDNIYYNPDCSEKIAKTIYEYIIKENS